MKQSPILKHLGLSEHATLVYETLITKDYYSPSTLVRDTKLHRPQVYIALAELENKKLVHKSTLKKRNVYRAVSPEKLEDLFYDFEKSFFEHIEDLHRTYESSQSHRPRITFGEGTESIKQAYSTMVETLNPHEKYYRYTALSDFNRKKYVPKNYEQLRDKKDLERLVITTELSRKKSKKNLGRTIKSIPAQIDLFEYNLSMLIYADKVTIIDFETESTIDITHRKFAEFQKRIFEMIFSKL